MTDNTHNYWDQNHSIDIRLEIKIKSMIMNIFSHQGYLSIYIINCTRHGLGERELLVKSWSCKYGKYGKYGKYLTSCKYCFVSLFIFTLLQGIQVAIYIGKMSLFTNRKPNVIARISDMGKKSHPCMNVL